MASSFKHENQDGFPCQSRFPWYSVMHPGQEFPFKYSKLTLFSGGISAVTAAAAATTGPNSLTSFASLSSSPLRWTVLWNWVPFTPKPHTTYTTPHLVCSPTQFYSVGFFQSRIFAKSVFLQLAIQVCFCRYPSGTTAQNSAHLTMSWFLCSSASNAWGEVEGASSALCQLKKPFKSPIPHFVRR